jgi:hypothetical protein
MPSVRRLLDISESKFARMHEIIASCLHYWLAIVLEYTIVDYFDAVAVVDVYLYDFVPDQDLPL